MHPLNRRLANGSPETRVRHAIWLMLGIAVIAAILIGLHSRSAAAQEPLQPGEAFVTRFSGTTVQGGRTVIDPNGTVGSIISLRQPGGPPVGAHWFNEPQRLPVIAAQVGQVFGVAIDAAASPNIYLAATSAFGLHRKADNSNWMAGQWGPGGPGTVWRLNAANGYQPEIFARITLDGRPNSGAALGNIAYDRWNRQLYVSDLETGMIHRLRISDGLDLGHYDHGVNGRASFFDAVAGAPASLDPVPFDTVTQARVANCAEGEFARTPSCWNFADFRRRVWGVAVRRDPASGEVRLYYSVWGSQGFGNANYASAGDDKRNAVWSVAIDPNGDFDTGSVRREFFLPDFFRSPEAIARAGLSHPVSDIAFSSFGDQDVMLLAERGGVRNLGLDAENAFAWPHESRVLRYELNPQGVWEPQGRYDVGYYDRREEGPPHIRAGSAGGVAFGTGYGENWEVDPARPDAFAWMTGDSLCSTRGLCFDGSANEHNDSSQVHGIQGRSAAVFENIASEAALRPYPAPGPATPATGPDSSFMIDADVNTDAAGNAVEDQLRRNDATRVGDVEIFQGSVPVLAQRPEEGPWYGPWEEDWPWPVPEGNYPPLPPPPGGGWPELALDKTTPDECAAGAPCTMGITVTNNGPGVYEGPLHVVDTPGGGILLGFSPGWNCEQPVPGGAIGCRRDPVTLAAGESVALELTLIWAVIGVADEAVTEFNNCGFIVWPGALEGAARIRAVEAALLLQGFDPGLVDGVADAATQTAIDAYRAANGLAPGGIDDAFMQTLFPGTSGMPGDGNPGNDWDCAAVHIPAPALPEPPEPPEGGPLDIQLQLIKEPLGDCAPGAQCNFRVRILNHGTDDYVGPIAINDYAQELPGDIVASGSIRAPAVMPCTPFGTGVQCVHPGPITLAATTGSWAFQISVDVPAEPTGDVMRNCSFIAWLHMGHPGPAGDGILANDWDCANANIVREAEPPVEGVDLVVEKTRVGDCTETVGVHPPWLLCNFAVTITNMGTADFEGPIAFSDQLSEEAQLGSPDVILDPSGHGWTCEASFVAGAEFTCQAPSVPLAAGGGATEVQVTILVPEGVDVTALEDNCAELAVPADDPNGNNRDCAPFAGPEAEPGGGPVPWGPAVEQFDLGIEGAGRESDCRPGGSCDVFFRVRNHGTGPFDGAIALTNYAETPDERRISSESISSLNSGWVCAPIDLPNARCRHTEEDHLPDVGAVSGTAMAVAMPDDYTQDTVRICARIAWDAMAIGPDGNADNDEFCVLRTVVLEDAIHEANLLPGGGTTCRRGENCTLDVWIENSGKKPFAGAAGLAANLSPAVRVVSAKGADRGLSCKVTGNGAYQCVGQKLSIKPGKGNAAHMTVVVAIPADFPHDKITHTKFMLWPDPKVKDKMPGDDRHVSTIAISGPKPPAPQPAPDLAVSKIATQGGCMAGQPCTFAVNVTNAGRGAFTGPLRLDDVITPSSARLTSSAPSSWSCSGVTGRISCSHPSTTLQPGQSRSLSLVFMTAAGSAGTLRNCAELARGAASTGSVLDVQQALAAQGFNPGTPDGKMGANTRRAIRDYQKRNGLTVTGRIDAALMASLFGGGADDANTANDKDCASVSLTAAEIPPAVLPAPECPSGWREVSSAESKMMATRGIPIQRVTAGRRTIFCARVVPTPPSAAPTCPSGWQQVSSNTSKKLAQQRWQIRRVGDTFCARPPEARPTPTPTPTPTLSCPPGWQQVSRDKAKALVQQRWQIRQMGNLMCAHPPAVTPTPTPTPAPAATCPSGWQQVSRNQAKSLVQKGYEIKQIGSALCARPRQQTGPILTPGPSQVTCTGGRVRNNQGKCVCPPNKPVWNGKQCVPRAQLQQTQPQQTPQLRINPQLLKKLPQLR